MRNFKINDDQGQPVVEFDGVDWTIHYDEDTSEEITHECVVESPVLLVRELENIGQPELLSEIRNKSEKLEELFAGFDREKQRLENRIVLFEKDGSGAVDSWIDRLSLTGDPKTGFIVETTIEGDPYDLACNALGEILAERCDNVFSAEELYRAILTVTNDQYCHWESIELSWSEIIENLNRHFPTLADHLRVLVDPEQVGGE